jgi:hypothetical protein
MAAVVSALLGLIGYAFYIRGMLKGNTQPHAYTWLIWSITLGTATFGVWYGGGGSSVIPFVSATVVTLIIFLLSFKYGTRNITKGDTIVLLLALFAIAAWWQFHAPLLSIAMVTGIDLFGYLPTFRKSFEEPWSEPLSSWLFFAVTSFFTFAGLSAYNFLTLGYILPTAVANLAVLFICLSQRKVIPKPAPH